ncbi:hypothetical protein [Persicobacter sp. CCB-QB2]|uniref:hypothetical protein n=1 Tax=Persicobacter sp. CCB-QB2 TaxID=1561025 RepID=UPI0012F75C00|nr:hypothetical protein [Persicobacter sp. CCB-QB2]
MRKFLLSFLTLLSFIYCPTSSVAQDLEDDGYNSQFVWGINKATNSGLIGGFVFRYSKALTENVYHSFGLEVVNIKHPKERRQQTLSGSAFILGKSNYLYDFRFQYGREWRLFRKAPQQGVQINFLASGGPSIGVVTPYYVEVSGGGDQGQRRIPYDPTVDLATIMGPEVCFRGFPNLL